MLKIEFYACLWNVVSVPLDEQGGARVIVRRGAFASALRVGSRPRLVVDHEGDDLARSLAMREDWRGLRVSAELLTGSRAARDCFDAIRAGCCLGASLWYVRPVWSAGAGRGVKSLVGVARLQDVSIMVGRPPAFPQTRAWVRALAGSGGRPAFMTNNLQSRGLFR